MIQPNDEKLLQKKGISAQQIEEQLKSFKSGFPYLIIRSSASVGNGIIRVNETELQTYLNEWGKYLTTNARVLKFVPASGLQAVCSRIYSVFWKVTAIYLLRDLRKSSLMI